MATRGLLERLQSGEDIIIAEGYMWELERRGYLKAGANVPEVVLDNPDVVKHMHEEFVHAGSDVVEAFTYYGHREKLRVIGREGDLERLNKDALKIARQVADSTRTLMAGGICNTGVYAPGDQNLIEQTKAMFKEQVEWAVEGGADFIIGETFDDSGEALLALEAIQEYGKGLPAVITLVPYTSDETTDGIPFPEACRKLEQSGAAVVGLNCGRGPKTMMPLIRKIRQACKGPVAAVPVPFRTQDNCRTFQSLKDPDTGKSVYPTDLAMFLCSRSQIRQFAEEAKEAGVQYIGICCGNASNYLREVAEVYGRRPPACNYSPDMSQNAYFGETSKLYDRAHKVREAMIGSSV